MAVRSQEPFLRRLMFDAYCFKQACGKPKRSKKCVLQTQLGLTKVLIPEKSSWTSTETDLHNESFQQIFCVVWELDFLIYILFSNGVKTMGLILLSLWTREYRCWRFVFYQFVDIRNVSLSLPIRFSTKFIMSEYWNVVIVVRSLGSKPYHSVSMTVIS
jgi:hypothetical protein